MPVEKRPPNVHQRLARTTDGTSGCPHSAPRASKLFPDAACAMTPQQSQFRIPNPTDRRTGIVPDEARGASHQVADQDRHAPDRSMHGRRLVTRLIRSLFPFLCLLIAVSLAPGYHAVGEDDFPRHNTAHFLGSAIIPPQ